MKKICAEKLIPTAKFKICNKVVDVNNFLKSCKYPIVVKADGLAAGKGVTICNTKLQAKNSAMQILNGKFKSSKKVVFSSIVSDNTALIFANKLLQKTVNKNKNRNILMTLSFNLSSIFV